MDRAQIVHENFLKAISEGDLPVSQQVEVLKNFGLSSHDAIRIFESQVLSRHLDIISRKLQAQAQGYYTIGSSGHEGNAAIAASLRVDDMAFLHYRDAAFLIERSKQRAQSTPLWDMLLSFAASSEDPIASGRHKVLGSKDLFIPPQTSTIASHLPKAVGAAYSIGLNRSLGLEGDMPDNAIAVCSFGDASVNHSTALGAINTACWTAYQGAPLPLLFVCEDNDIGISTFTPEGWVQAQYQHKAGLKYFSCDGLNIFDTYHVANQAQEYVRKNQKPAFLHFKCIRLYGHAGADMQAAYMKKNQIEETESHDPLLYSAGLLVSENILSLGDILNLYNEVGARVERVAEEAIKRPKLTTAPEIMESIVPPKKEDVRAASKVSDQKRKGHFDREYDAQKQLAHMAKLINWALHDEMLKYPEIVLAGEDIGPKGGVYNVTANLHAKFGGARVINTLLDEQSILGLAIGMAHNNLLSIPEIQFLAYLHNAEDQLRGEAATLSFFSNGQYTNPMVVRIAGLAYQRGFGGHFHNDNSFNVLRDIPGVIVACPSNGLDAASMLRECVRLAREERRVVVFLEPIALYMTRDLHEEKDGGWSFKYSEAGTVSFGEIAQHGKGKELAILTYGNGYYISRQAAKILEEEHQIKLRVIDIRWLCPLPEENILKSVEGCDHVLIVDECRKTGSVSEELMTLLKNNPKVERLCADDSFIPLGKAYASTLPSKESITEAAVQLVGKAS
ncbi:MAG: thiamine pyrophosphate-dependent enzyme [Alphaproteobacteria bacterium]|nr:thiamine pyrophosphate-dependent enzyme [Alphaproteobacteria bacterium]